MFAHDHRRFTIFSVVTLLGLTVGPLAQAACPVEGIPPSQHPRDPVAQVLERQTTCPRSPAEFVDALKRLNVRMEPTLSSFAGFHNPAGGGFMIFEIASTEAGSAAPISIQRGDLLFGHFANVDGDAILSKRGGLAIELIAWDPDKQFYNFYDLAGGRWLYRGDSTGILDEVEHLHRMRTGTEQPIVGKIRCSPCHINGGLLQKELAVPHNDWSVQDRKYSFKGLTPDPFVKSKIDNLVDAGELSKLVAASPQRLADSKRYQQALGAKSMQVQLRPLFCPMEVNIESDSQPSEGGGPSLRIPSAFFVDPRLGSAEISIERRHYNAALAKLKSELPDGSGRTDADHGWLTPVKAHSDIVAVDSLIKQGVVDRKFATAVLGVDFTNPAFSKTRCDLLKVVPDQGGPGFVGRFQSALRGASLPGVGELIVKLSDPADTVIAHYEMQARELLDRCRARASEPDAVLDWVRLLAQRRADVSASEISQVEDRHILEEGRIIFPTTAPEAIAGNPALTPSCLVR